MKKERNTPKNEERRMNPSADSEERGGNSLAVKGKGDAARKEQGGKESSCLLQEKEKDKRKPHLAVSSLTIQGISLRDFCWSGATQGEV